MLQFPAFAQTNATDTAAVVHTNTAIIPVPREGSATNRQSLVLQRAKDNPGAYDIEFIGDSITQGWEGAGKNIWQQYYGQRKVINLGVGGDRTQHVLWRFEQGQLDGIKAKVAVVMIGTNNSNNQDNTEAEILEGVAAIVAPNPHAPAGHENHSARHFPARQDLQRPARENSAGQPGARQAG